VFRSGRKSAAIEEISRVQGRILGATEEEMNAALNGEERVEVTV